MRQLPSGTVTFLFTDIEGSTQLLHDIGDGYDEVLADHRRMLREAFDAHSGCEVGTEGDSFFIAFASAADAVSAACAAQRALHAHAWPGGVGLRVRMGMHTGEARIVSDDYVGLAVHQAARISSSAHGGQIVVSQTTHDLVSSNLPAGVTLVDLGAHTLKDFPQTARLFQVAHEDLPAEFPRLRSLDVRRHNLPTQLTNFIGREHEVEDVRKLLAENRLVTLTGAGGSGKTRLAIEVAADALDGYADGVRLVDLAPVTDADLVPQAVVNALGLREQEGHTVESVLEDYVALKQLLLLLDNCEHLVGACADLVERLLKASTEVTVLVTTREPLGVDGEIAWRVPSLGAPDPKERPSIEELRSSEAIRLFLERAASVDAAFSPDESDIRAIGQICHRLDGIPLAIELAAARTEVLTPSQICDRLDDRFKLLTGGKRTALARQQTLRALVDWSYELLDDAEAALLNRISIFVGGFTLEAAEQVCAGEHVDAGDVLDLLSQLVRKSLVSVDKRSGEVRYVLLETIKQYGREKLLALPEAIVVRRAHKDHFLALAEEAARSLSGADQLRWLDRLEREHDNLRTAIEWCLADDDIDSALRIIGSIWRFWWMRGYWSEGRTWTSQILDTGGGSDELRARGLFVAAFLATFMADNEIARSFADRCLEAARAVSDEHLAGYALFVVGYITRQHDRPAARTFLDQSLEIGRTFADDQLIAWSLFISSGAINADEDKDRAHFERCTREALEVARRSGDQWCIAMALGNLAGLDINRGNLATARVSTEEAVAVLRELKDFYGLASRLTNLGIIELREGNEEKAYGLFEESLELAREAGDRSMMMQILPQLGARAAQRGDRSTADAYFQEAITAGRSSGMTERLGYALNAVAWFSHLDGNDAAALPLAEEALACFRQLHDPNTEVATMHTIAEIKRALGDHAGAVEILKEALAKPHDEFLHNKASCIEAIAGAFVSLGRLEIGARLFGAADAVRETMDTGSEDKAGLERDIALLRGSMDAEDLERAWQAGKQSVDETIRIALEER